MCLLLSRCVAITLAAQPPFAFASNGIGLLPVLFWLATPMLLAFGSLTAALIIDWGLSLSERRRAARRAAKQNATASASPGSTTRYVD